MSKVNRRKRHKREQQKQSNQHDRQAAPPLLDQVPAQAEVDKSAWAPADGPLGRCIQTETQSTLNAYRSKPILVARDANIENSIARGGYAHEQLRELIQNSADALLDSCGGRINLKLTDTHLYCADDGQAIGQQSVRELLVSHMSSKRGTDKIGRFGLGFKSVLGVTEAPEFFSQSGSFRFDRAEAENQIRSVVPGTGPCPTLVLAFPMNPLYEMEQDADLCAFMGWATNIVRLPLQPGAFEELTEQCETFRVEFLLLTKHVSQITIQIGADERLIHVQREAGIHTLFDGTEQSQWKVYSAVHELSDEAQADRPDDGRNASIDWAIPIDRKVEGKFWAYFPTQTASLLNGILNAPWKTSDDRQNLLKGVYNDELIEAAAELVAVSIADLSSAEDPGSHLDVLPRRPIPDDNEHCSLLRDRLYGALAGRDIVPDQCGVLCQLHQLHYQPTVLAVGRTFAQDALAAWVDFEHRPTNWLHHSALRWNRLVRCEWLHAFAIEQPIKPAAWNPEDDERTMSQVTVDTWLEALVQVAEGQPQAVEASKAAIRTAAKLQDFRSDKDQDALASKELGAIVLTVAASWAAPDPEQLFMGSDTEEDVEKFVHPELEQCTDTVAALQRLGIKPLSDQKKFEKTVSNALGGFLTWHLYLNYPGSFQKEKLVSTVDEHCGQLWSKSRFLPSAEAADIIRREAASKVSHIIICLKISAADNDISLWTEVSTEYSNWTNDIDWREAVPVRTANGGWTSLAEVLLPGEIVPGDGSRDADVAVDIEFHRADLELLKQLGVVSVPVTKRKLPPHHHHRYRRDCRTQFQTEARDRKNGKPQLEKLDFDTKVCAGPLGPLARLSEEGLARYTWRLLEFDTTYAAWGMTHETRSKHYGTTSFPSPAIEVLREYGMIRTATGIVSLSDGVGESPTNLEVAEALLTHPRADQIRQAFNIQFDLKTGIEVVGEDEGVPIVDEWPALQRYLTQEELELNLVRCEGFHRSTGSMTRLDLNCVRMGNSMYVAQLADESEELSAVLKELNKPLHQEFLEGILNGSDPIDVQNAVEAVRQWKTDEERLLAAVGIEGLKRLLPKSLPSMLTEQQGSATGLELARAAIAKFHTGALKAYKDDLQHLNPPRMWAGSERAVRFVQSLGFDEEWAGHRDMRREPFLEVSGPRTLPPLHDYQETAVQKVRDLVTADDADSHRGLLSMPTGSGKTRVAVQALVESMRDGEVQDGILWVADRDELCEQAVEAWQAVWASEGEQAGTLRISRMWGRSSERPRPNGKRHVIVASIQTLHSRFARRPAEYQFLSDFNLVVVDEAHRSVAPSYTTVLQELGLTRWYRDYEPTLIGLTATPYRGFNEEETRRLQYRYGEQRLDHGVFPTRDSNEVILSLQAQGVLAMADHATIDGGDFSLSDDERALAEKNPWLPQSVEDRIALDAVRTRRIVDEYLHKVDPEWPTLIFATSVEHSEIVAALLNSEGITARAVSGGTETSVRRSVVQEFRSGGVKVLVNYGVFREGFDAPKTRAIIVARPVYSPNLYFQMVGRGLRGVENGGNERCLILNVKDNIRNFGQDLAFTELDWLWAD
ncbi:MAG: DEAD/DEAH box helicase [Caldilineaceae bacterium SB0666_bin_21]|nr:DEAD/DEAH box helicase [Caldilineaceae bacterium SB0666_bin_21]